MAHSLTAEQTINGAYGTLSMENLQDYVDFQGNVTTGSVPLANVQSVEARVNIDRRDIKLAGSRMTHYKAIGSTGEGSFTIFRVTSAFMNMGVDALTANDKFESLGGGGTAATHLSMTVKLSDPESPNGATESVVLSKVKIWEIPFGFSVDDLVQQTITFTFQSMKLTSYIV